MFWGSLPTEVVDLFFFFFQSSALPAITVAIAGQV